MKWSLEELAAWARFRCVHERIQDLLQPLAFEFPPAPDVFEAAWTAVGEALDPPCRRTLDRALMAATLARKALTPHWLPPALETHLGMGSLGFPFSWREALQGQWVAFPIALVNDDHASLAWALIGQVDGMPLGPGWPRWWETMADPHARGGVGRALHMLEARFDSRFFFWPVLPEFHHPVVFGPSLALPVFMAGWALGTGVGGRSILCTGDILEDGSLGEVGFLERKAQLASSHGFRVLLCPGSTKKPPAGIGGTQILEARNIEHACFLWELSDGGICGSLQTDFHSLTDPSRLAATVHLLSNRLIRWSGFDAQYRQVVEEIAQSTSLMEDFVRNLERLASNPNSPRDCLRRLMAPVDPGFLGRLGSSHPLSALRLAQVQVTLANHEGRIDEAERWTRASRSLVTGISNYEEAIKWKADQLNREFIHHRHNHYDFREELPAELADTLAQLESLWGVQKVHHPHCTLPSLGKLYGTLAQNCGFCGPEHMEDLHRYAGLAQRAFGDGRLAETLADWQRQFIYIFYGLLDSGDLEGAHAIFPRVTGQDVSALAEDSIRRLNPYQHAAVARLLAETGAEAPAYREWMRRHVGDRPCKHPWPLWLTNAARCLEERSERREALTGALQHCLSMGPTAQVMGLMPLQLLWHEGLQAHGWIGETAKRLLEVVRVHFGRNEHFRDILECPGWEDALFSVARLKPRLFPFTYR